MPEQMTTLSVATVCILDKSGCLLTVRKRGTVSFMLPGGKPEVGETMAETAVRELEEELGIRLGVHELEPLGVWSGTAANEADTVIEANLFKSQTTDAPVCAAEIEEISWIHPLAATHRTDLAPLLTEHVLPELSQQH